LYTLARLSDDTALQFGVLRLRVFVQYAEDVDDIFWCHGVHHHMFADNMQRHCSGRLDDVPATVSQLESCIIDIYAWCGAERLQLNADSTEPLWFDWESQLRRLPSHNNSINVNQCIVKPVTVVWACDSMLSYQCTHMFLGWCRHVLPSVPNTCRSTTARPRRHSETSYSTCPDTSALLQWSSSFHAGTIPVSPACSGMHHSGSQAA